MSSATRKNRSRRTLSTNKKDITIFFLELLSTIKMYHWNTYDYAAHKATDDVHAKLSGNIDKFMEIFMGATKQRINIGGKTTLSLVDLSKDKMEKCIIGSIRYLEKLKLPENNTDLYNIRDEMIGDLNQFLYLFTFK